MPSAFDADESEFNSKLRSVVYMKWSKQVCTGQVSRVDLWTSWLGAFSVTPTTMSATVCSGGYARGLIDVATSYDGDKSGKAIVICGSTQRC